MDYYFSGVLMRIDLKHKIVLETFIRCFLLVFYIFLFVYAESLIESAFLLGSDPTRFPKAILFCCIGLCFVLLFDIIKVIISYKKNIITINMKELLVDAKEEYYPVIKMCLYVLVLILYCLGFYYIGFLYSTPFVIVFVAYLLGFRKLLLGFVISIVITLILDYGTLKFLQILLPRGALFE